jgi:integrase
LDIAEGYTRKHLLPAWGTERLLDLSAKRLDGWLVDLYRNREIAPATINKLLQTLRTILERAVLDGWLEENPADHVKSVRVPTPSRSILSPSEAVRLLATPEPWSDFRHYAINVLAASTGIRMGEVRALLVENVKRDHVEIRRSWEQGYGPRPPKADSVRDVPISPKVSSILFKVIEETQPAGLMFFGRGDMDTPMSKGVIENHLRRALCTIGILVAEQTRRHLTFHAWRHFLNSMLRSHGVADVKTRRITGHRTAAMTDWYTDWKALDLSEVVSIQTALLEPPGLAATG